MSLVSWAKKELARLGIQKSRKLLLPQTRLTPAKSLSPLPELQEVVIAADLRCAECQKRISSTLSQIDDVESVVFHVSEKKVTVLGKSTLEASQ